MVDGLMGNMNQRGKKDPYWSIESTDWKASIIQLPIHANFLVMYRSQRTPCSRIVKVGCSIIVRMGNQELNY